MTPTRYDRRTFLRLGGAAVAGVGTAGCTASGAPDSRTVDMVGLAFDPETVTVAAGGTIRWVNESEVQHTVTAYEDRIPDGAAYFASGGYESEQAARNGVSGGLIGPGGSYEHTFEQTGTYEYFCIPHEGSGMVGSVQVK